MIRCCLCAITVHWCFSDAYFKRSEERKSISLFFSPGNLQESAFVIHESRHPLLHFCLVLGERFSNTQTDPIALPEHAISGVQCAFRQLQAWHAGVNGWPLSEVVIPHGNGHGNGHLPKVGSCKGQEGVNWAGMGGTRWWWGQEGEQVCESLT